MCPCLSVRVLINFSCFFSDLKTMAQDPDVDYIEQSAPFTIDCTDTEYSVPDVWVSIESTQTCCSLQVQYKKSYQFEIQVPFLSTVKSEFSDCYLVNFWLMQIGKFITSLLAICFS